MWLFFEIELWNCFLQNLPHISLKKSNFPKDSKTREQAGKLGINCENFESEIHNNNEKSAIATIILLNQLKSDYSEYLGNIASKYTPEQTNRKLTLDEYLAVRWKGLRVDEFNQDKEVKKAAKSNVDAIVQERQNPQPPTKEKRALDIIRYNREYTK